MEEGSLRGRGFGCDQKKCRGYSKVESLLCVNGWFSFVGKMMAVECWYDLYH